MTHLTYYASFIPCSYSIIPISLSNKLHQDVTVSCAMTKTKTYSPCECEYIIIISLSYNLSENTDNYTTVCKHLCSEPSLGCPFQLIRNHRSIIKVHLYI
jgi:hypothetical protein